MSNSDLTTLDPSTLTLQLQLVEMVVEVSEVQKDVSRADEHTMPKPGGS